MSGSLKETPMAGGRAVIRLLIAFASTVPGSLLAQSGVDRSIIRGVVVEATTGQPLPAARVHLLGTHREELAHRDGTFAFADLAAGRYIVAVDHLGYATQIDTVQLAAGADESLRFELSVAAIRLDDLMVTGAITRREVRDVLGAVSVVSGAELDRRLDATVGATLRGEPGLAVTSIGPATARPVIRGLGGNRIVMLEDGQPTGDLSSLSADHAVAIDALTARQFEVVRGPMSLLYGSSALGGVVNVIRDEIPNALPEHTHGTLAVQASSVSDGLSGGAQMNFRAGTFAIRTEASGRTSGDVQTPVGTLLNTQARTLGAAAGATWVGESAHAGLAYRYYDNDYGIPGGFVGGHATGVDIEMRRHSLRGRLELHRDPGLLSGLSADFGFTDYFHAELSQTGSVSTRFGQTLLNSEIVARHSTADGLRTGAAGIRAQYRDITTGGSLRTPSTWDVSLAGFLVEELSTGRFHVQAGLRYDWAHYNPRDTSAYIAVGGEFVPVRERDFGAVSASLGTLFDLTGSLRLGINLNRAYRTPDFNELYSNGPHLAANSYDVGDTFLDEETGLGIDAFLRYAHPRARVELAAFHNTLNDYIFPSSRGRAELGQQGGRPRFQYTNEDARFVGAEADAHLSITPRLLLDATASYVRATFTSARAPIPIIEDDDTTFVPASEAPPLIPPFNGEVGLRWEDPGLLLGANVRWAAAQKRLGDFESRTAGYAVAGLHAGIRVSRGGRLHTVMLRVDNLFDTEYRDHLSRIREIMPEPGRDLSVLYRLNF